MYVLWTVDRSFRSTTRKLDCPHCLLLVLLLLPVERTHATTTATPHVEPRYGITRTGPNQRAPGQSYRSRIIHDV